MSAQRGVLAVMDQAAISLTLYPTSGPKPTEQLREARAAVAELIEAAEAVAGAHLTDVEIYDAQPRLRAALAKVQP